MHIKLLKLIGLGTMQCEMTKSYLYKETPGVHVGCCLYWKCRNFIPEDKFSYLFLFQFVLQHFITYCLVSYLYDYTCDSCRCTSLPGWVSRRSCCCYSSSCPITVPRHLTWGSGTRPLPDPPTWSAPGFALGWAECPWWTPTSGSLLGLWGKQAGWMVRKINHRIQKDNG